MKSGIKARQFWIEEWRASSGENESKKDAETLFFQAGLRGKDMFGEHPKLYRKAQKNIFI